MYHCYQTEYTNGKISAFLKECKSNSVLSVYNNYIWCRSFNVFASWTPPLALFFRLELHVISLGKYVHSLNIYYTVLTRFRQFSLRILLCRCSVDSKHRDCGFESHRRCNFLFFLISLYFKIN